MAAEGLDPKRQVLEIGVFHDVAKALTSSLNLDSILQTILEKMAAHFHPDNWSLLMVDESKGELYFAIAVGDAAQSLKNLRLKVGEGIAGWVAQHGEPLIVPDVYTDPRFAKRIDERTKWQTRSIICLPLKSRQRVLGVIQLINCTMETLGDKELFFLQALSDYAAIAIDNARAVEKIQELTITDDVTGLYNARHLYKTLEAEVYRSARFGYEFSVIFIDLDHFKQVNDTNGHLAGSKLLTEIGFKIKIHLRLIDYAFRYGGDEFVILMPETGVEQACVLSERLRLWIATDPMLNERHITGSFGVAEYPLHGSIIEDVVRQADAGMYISKRAGGNKVSTAEPLADDSPQGQVRKVIAAQLGGFLRREHITNDEEIIGALQKVAASVGDKDVDMAVREALRTITRAVETREMHSTGHGDTVASYVEAIARELSYPEIGLPDLIFAAQVHDVGKVVIPETILSKAGSLSFDEFQLMK
ncbi:MAG: diguanylate cyclase, partial [Burkholderiales bacterium]